MPTTFSTDAASPKRATRDGVPFFPRILYDSGDLTNFPGPSIDALNLARFKATHYLNYQNGVQPWPMGQCPNLAALGMFNTAIGNAFGSFQGDPNLSVIANPMVNGVPFRTAFAAAAGAGLVYLGDETNVSTSPWITAQRATYHADMPNLPVLHILLPEGPLSCVANGAESQYGSAGYMEHQLSVANPYWWMRQNPGGNDWMGEDVYPLFKNETDTVNGVGAQGGYPHFWVADRTAHCVAAAKLYGKVPVMAPQFFTGLNGARFPRPDEVWAHFIMQIAEGSRGIAPWQIGPNGGLLTQTHATRIPAEQCLMEIFDFIATHEASILSDPIAGWTNSTQTGDALTWRKAACLTAANACQQTSYGDGGRGSYIAERNALLDGCTTWSPMLDQLGGNLRTRVFREAPNKYLVFTYNYGTTALTGATITAPGTIASLTVLCEGRTLTPVGNHFTDDWGGSSSLLQGPKRIGHIYEVVLA